MEWLDRMKASINYIEDNLDGEVDFGEAAKKAYCSVFHFHRIFSIITGVTTVEYVRRRRLTLAAQELMCKDAKVIDIALKYGYDSPDAFTRAFQKVHGVSPSTARESGVQLVAYPRISFQMILKGGIDMDYRIVGKGEFTVIGKSKKFTDQEDGAENIPKFWGELKSSGLYGTMVHSICRGKTGAVTDGESLGICKGEGEGFSYIIGVEKPDGEIPDGFEIISIPAATWAVFESTGPMPGAIQSLWKRIYEEWFPSTGYEQAGIALDFEVYMPGDMDSTDYRSQIWIPIVKKNK
jgi:AraC family transcriptional regulator